MKEENKPVITFEEFLKQNNIPAKRKNYVVAFADYFLNYFDTITQLSVVNEIPREKIIIVLTTELEKYDKLRFKEVAMKIKNGEILDVADYIIFNKASTRQAAEHFPYSNVTIHTWMTTKLEKVDPVRYKKVSTIIQGHKRRSIEDVMVVKRILLAVELILKGYTVEQIAAKLSTPDEIVTPATIYGDLGNRLLKLDPEKAEIVSRVLKQHSLENLRNQPKSR